ncbi:hypothetical protein FW774_08720 [Pedobacter sp. BS3]|uniref:putative quinol monooxygenase n=1 Tax=Pedobacter sp. BS3 TaxID=2567937 RepID=UPI0011ED04D5|nr:antibiotic biosynthesis monooxygenase [Pedobacter sp. BS3]TZF83559.1 hypothetical protein FW774_08720 [Pedobacter sp. BS3]
MTSSNRNILTLKTGAIALLFALTSCTGNTNKKEKFTETIASDTTSIVDTVGYQHIMFVKVKPEKWDTLMKAMYNNVVQTRKEPGSVLFTFFQPEDGRYEVALLERFKNRAVFEDHLKKPYLPHQVWKEAKEANDPMEMKELKELAEVPAVEPENADEIYSPRNVLVTFDVKPEKRQVFLDAIAAVTPRARQAKGNTRFNVFQYVENANKFLLVESWESVPDHEAHLAQDYSKKFDAAIKGIFVSNPVDTRWLAKDISK